MPALRTLASRLGEILDGLIEQPFFLGGTSNRRRILVDPSVNANLVSPRLQDRRDHLGVQNRADRRNEERRRDRVLVEKREHPRQAFLRAKLGCGKRRGRRLARSQQIRFVVHVEAQAHGDPCIARPTLRGQLAARPNRRHGFLDLLLGPFDARLFRDLLSRDPHGNQESERTQAASERVRHGRILRQQVKHESYRSRA
jgi:hypothetical protein